MSGQVYRTGAALPFTFARHHLGSYVTAPGGAGRECVDLANLYLLAEYDGAHVYLNAVDWAGAAIPGFVWVPNTPTNTPPPGALVVWKPYPPLHIGPNGHIALVLGADVLTMVTADQNWPDGAPVGLHLHAYDGVAGWQAPQP